MITRRKRSILELAVATACFGAAAVAAAMPVTAIAAPQSASAQSTARHRNAKKKQVANANLLHEVVVNGFISSIQNAIAIQKNSDSIVEAVSAQQIGRLPGTSIAAALGRLPGLATQVVNGHAQSLSIHGLSSDFDVTQVDGIPQASTANNRDVQLDQYPASWFKTVKVHLSPSARLIGQGIAGTVNMITIRPLDERRPMVNVNAMYDMLEPNVVMPGPGVSNAGHDVNAMVVDQFFHHTLGVAFGVDLNATPTHTEYQAPWGYAQDKNKNLIIGGSKNYNLSDLQKRNGYIADFEWRPNSAFTSNLVMTYTDLNETEQAKGAEFPLAYGSGETEIPGTTVNGFDQTGTFQNVYPVIRNDYNHYQARVYNIISQNRITLADHWTASLDASYNRAERQDLFLESYSGYGYDGPANESTLPGTNVNFNEGSNGQLFLYPTPQGLSGSNIVLTDPQGWGAGAHLVQAGFINSPHVEDYIANIRLAATHYFSSGPFSSIDFGVDRSHRRKDYIISQDFLVLPGASCGYVISSTCTPTQTAPIPSAALEPTTDALGFMGIGPQVMYNPFSLIGSGQLIEYPTALSSIAIPPNWVIDENDTTAFFQLNIATNLTSDIGLRGNVGLQITHTGSTSSGQRVAPGSTAGGAATTVLLPMIGGNSYTRYLPSLNLVFSLPGDNDFRFSVARTMARPRMDYMSSSIGINTNVTGLTNTNPNLGYFSGSGGNPNLLPTMATNYNASIEHYFGGSSGGYNCNSTQSKTSSLCTTGGEGYVQLSGYYIDLTDYINPTAATLTNFSAYESAYLSPTQQAELGTPYGIMTIPNNSGAGHIEGVQVATNIPFGDLTPYLNGFGGMASIDRTLSSVHYPGNSQPVTVDGLSKWVDNYTLYYQYGGFQASVTDSYRSSFLGRVFGISATRVEQVVKPQTFVDAQVSYQFTSGALKNLTLIATGSNLTNQGEQTFQNNDPRQVITWNRYSRMYQIGFSYLFHY